MVHKFYDKKARDTGTQTRTGISANKEFFNELHNSIAKKIKKPKTYSSYWDKILGADLADF